MYEGDDDFKLGARRVANGSTIDTEGRHRKYGHEMNTDCGRPPTVGGAERRK
jgi:hypothetical protein